MTRDRIDVDVSTISLLPCSSDFGLDPGSISQMGTNRPRRGKEQEQDYFRPFLC